MKVKSIQESLNESVSRNLNIFIESESGPLTLEKIKEVVASAINNQAAEWAMRMVEVPDDYDMAQLAAAHVEKAIMLLDGNHALVRSSLYEAVKMLNNSIRGQHAKEKRY